ncbi:MAG: type I-MYXAN CRISPR-associated protein Cas6/Cmx6 [Sutterellaceae bacterium]|nr:type I-MYXAN CRISPR-associated protein Cas6/Cmx6 [Burkholderiaceae bacterium]MDW8429247.1 type I-MYXAN CRISPR-associated protein Cas6/Cmx6 [Sutterellaceae bacterium]
MVDIVFPLRGGPIAPEYADALSEQLCAALPWLCNEAGAGVHPLRGTTSCGAELLLSGRAALALRVPAARSQDCKQLEGVRLDLGGTIEVGTPRRRPLFAHPTLYSHLVVTDTEDEARFVADVRQALAAWNVHCDVIVGRRQSRRLAGTWRTGFSVMLHGLPPAASMHAQCAGLGAYRLLGCGLFVPHKSADPAFQ